MTPPKLIEVVHDNNLLSCALIFVPSQGFEPCAPIISVHCHFTDPTLRA